MSRKGERSNPPGAKALERELEALDRGTGIRGPGPPPDDHEGSNDHLALIYESREEQFAAVVPFIRQGLERGERCVYVAHENSRDEVLERLREAGVDVDAALESGALSVLGVHDTYLEGGTFDLEESLALLEDTLEETAGFEGLRMSVEETWLLEEDSTAEEFMALEARVNDLFRGEDCTALCQYDRERFPADLLRDVIRTHPHLVHDSRVSHNTYYRPPGEYFGRDRPATEVDRKLETLHERTEQEQNHQRVIEALEAAEEGISLLGDDGEFIYVNDAYADTFGYAPEEMIGEHWDALGIEADPEYVYEEVLPTVEREGQWTGTTTCVRGDDTTFVADHSLTRTEDGELICVVRDVTERKERERDLELFRNLIDESNDAVFVIDPDTGRLLDVNDTACRRLGYDRDELLEMSVPDIDRRLSGRADWQRHVEDVKAEGGITFEGTRERKDGSTLPVEINDVHADLDEEYVLSIARDVTERRERERELRRTKDRFEAVFEHSNDAIFVNDPHRDEMVDANPAGLEMLGYEREELLSLGPSDVHPDEMDAFRAFVDGVFEKGYGWTDELSCRTKDGEYIPAEISASAIELEDRKLLLAVVRDITERKEHERYQRRLHEITADGDLNFDEKLDELLELGCARFDLDIGMLTREHEGAFEIERMHGSHPDLEEGTLAPPQTDNYCRRVVDTGESIGVTDAGEAGWDDDALYRQFDLQCYAGTRVDAGDSPYGTVCFADRSPRERAFTDDERTFLELMGQWISYEMEREEREGRLAALNTLARDLMDAETATAVSETVVEAAERTLDLPITAIALYDDRKGELEPVAATEAAAEFLRATSLLEVGDGAGWNAFVEGSPRRVTDPLAGTDVSVRPPVTEVVALPLANHGLLVTGTTATDGIRPERVEFAETVAANVQAVFDRVDRERQLQERERTLQEQNETLERLNRVNDVIRNIDQALIGASTRADVEAAVCEQLAGVGTYEMAWIGEQDTVTREVTPREWAGSERGYLDEITITTADGSGVQEPTGRAIETREPQVVNDILDDPSFEPWRQAALNRGYHACITLPLVYEDTTYGVLEVYSGQPGVFDELERAVLAEMADTIAYAVNAVERKRALVGNEVTRLEFTVDDPALEIVEMARELDCRVAMESLMSRPDGGLRMFLSTRGAPAEEVLEFAPRLPVTDLTLLSECDEGEEPFGLFDASLDDGSLGATVVEHGGRPCEFTVADGTATVTIELATDAAVRQFVEMFRTEYPDSELVAQRDRERPQQTPAEFFAGVTEGLTARQLEALQTAYFGGYFEEPRTLSATEIADTMGLAQSTFSSHLRAAHREVCRQLFEEETPLA